MAGSPFAPDDEEDGTGTYGPAAMLLPPAAAPAPSAAPIPYLVPPAQPSSAPAAAGVTLNPPPVNIARPLPPAVPSYNTDAENKTSAQAIKDGTVDRAANAPKWWERLAGAAVGFGAGYKGGAAEGVRVGSAVTNRRYDSAVADSQQKVAADNAALQNLQRNDDQQHRAYMDQVDQFNVGDRLAQQQQGQANSDREFGQQQSQAQQAQQNFQMTSKQRADQIATQTNFEHTKFEEQQRHNKATEGAQQERADKYKSGGGSGGGSAAPGKGKALTDNQVRQLDREHDMEYRDADTAHTKALKDAAGNPQATQAAEQDYSQARANLQDRWNTRYADAFPNGRPSASRSAQPNPAQPQQPAQQQAKQLTDPKVAQQYLAKAGGDKGKARQLAKADGYTF